MCLYLLFKYQNTFNNAMFKWFWTIFSLGAPDNTGQTLLGEWEIYRPQFSDIPKIDNLNFGGITRENREGDWDFSLARVILRSAIKTGQNRFWEKKWLTAVFHNLHARVALPFFPFICQIWCCRNDVLWFSWVSGAQFPGQTCTLSFKPIAKRN